MEFMDVLTARRSVRSYTPTPLDRATIEKLIHAAMQAPSATNTQPWAFGVITGVERLKEYGDRVKAKLLPALDQMPELERYRDMITDPKYNVFHGAPALVVIYGKPASLLPEIDCALAAQNLMLAAAAMNLGTCWIGFAQEFFDPPAVKAELGVPESYKAIAPIIVGHPAGTTPPVPRNTPEVVYWM